MTTTDRVTLHRELEALTLCQVGHHAHHHGVYRLIPGMSLRPEPNVPSTHQGCYQLSRTPNSVVLRGGTVYDVIYGRSRAEDRERFEHQLLAGEYLYLVDRDALAEATRP